MIRTRVPLLFPGETSGGSGALRPDSVRAGQLWWGGWGSNPRPADYESSAPPAPWCGLVRPGAVYARQGAGRLTPGAPWCGLVRPRVFPCCSRARALNRMAYTKSACCWLNGGSSRAASCPAAYASSTVRQSMTILSALGDVSAATLHDVHQALGHEDAHRLAGRLAGDALLLHQPRLGRNGPPRPELPRLDPGAQERRYLLVHRLRRPMIDSHAPTVPGRAPLQSYASVYGRMPLSAHNVLTLTAKAAPAGARTPVLRGLTGKRVPAMANHPPEPEIVLADIGGWISGPMATEPVRADEIRRGDVVVHDGRALVVTEQPLSAWYYEQGERQHGLEIPTRANGSRWCLYRGYSEIVHRSTLVACAWCDRLMPPGSVRPCCDRPDHDKQVCIDADDCFAAIQADAAERGES